MIPKYKNAYALLFKILTLLLLFGFFLFQGYVADAYSELKFAWSPPEGTNPEDIGGYYLYWGNASKNYVERTHLGKVYEGTVTELVEGNKYYFAVTCYYKDKPEEESIFSNEVAKTIPAADPPPDPVADADPPPDPVADADPPPDPVADPPPDPVADADPPPDPVADADPSESEDVDLSGNWGWTALTIQNSESMLFSKFRLKNLGMEDVKSVTIRFYQSEDDEFDESDNQIAEHVVSDLKAGASVRIGLRIENFIEIGSEDYLIAEIDPADDIMEFNEENNISISSVIKKRKSHRANRRWNRWRDRAGADQIESQSENSIVEFESNRANRRSWGRNSRRRRHRHHRHHHHDH
jgi:hypothetical protein